LQREVIVQDGLLIPFAIATLAGCATYKPIPENYTGPIATVADSGQSEDSTKAQIFALSEIDGHGIRDSFGTSHQASYGQGALLRLAITERQVPARAMKVKIRGSHATGAPMRTILRMAAALSASLTACVPPPTAYVTHPLQTIRPDQIVAAHPSSTPNSGLWPSADSTPHMNQ
jgi:hypothetical protein